MQKASLNTFLGLLGFMALVALAVTASGLMSGLLLAMLAMSSDGLPAIWMHSAVTSALLLLATWCALRIERSGFSALGITFARQHVREFAGGLLMGAVLFGLLTASTAWWVGVQWRVDWAVGMQAMLLGLPMALLMLLPEELVFRGYAFRQVQALWGAPAALALSSLLFGVYHLLGSGDWAMGAVFRFAMPVLGGLVFGYALLRTGGLAMPIGLHLGGNWIQASVLGLGREPGSALWTASLDVEQIRGLSAPDLIPHLPYLATMLLLAICVLRWRGAGSVVQ